MESILDLLNDIGIDTKGTKEELKLTDEQEGALNLVKEFIPSEDQYMLLSGSAGCGKTTCVQSVVRYIQDSESDDYTVIVAAPTNKAVKVLRDKSREWGVDVEASTIHKLLAIKPRINYDTGEEFFEVDRNIAKRDLNNVFLIIDEASMINKHLFKEIQNAVNTYKNCKVLFVGDNAQLPPVKEKESEVFEVEKKALLTTVVRHEGCILDLATYIRNDLHSRKLDLEQFAIESDVSVLGDKEWYTKLAELLKDTQRIDNPDFARVIVWTNELKRKINLFCRAVVYGKEAYEIEIGETLLTNSPVIRSSKNGGLQVLLQVSDEVQVLNVEESTHQYKATKQMQKLFNTEFVFDIWETKVHNPYDDLFVTLPILRDDEKRRFDILMTNITRKAKSKDTDADDVRRLWKLYFGLKDTFADMDYSFSITSHKAQGSTYVNAFVHTPDILKNPNVVERNQCLYVSCSRPSKQLILLK